MKAASCLWQVLAILLVAAAAAACQLDDPGTGDGTEPTRIPSISNADGTCPNGGFRIDDETHAVFNTSDWYRVQPFGDLKYEPESRPAIELEEGSISYIAAVQGQRFEVHGWGSAGYACFLKSHETNARNWQREQAQAAAAKRERAAAAERSKRAEQAAAKQAEAVSKRAEAAAEARRKANRTNRQIAEDCFDPWDGNWNQLERRIRERLKDPGSMETISTRFPTSGTMIVDLQYRARNSFGGYAVGTAIAEMNTNDCSVRRVIQWE